MANIYTNTDKVAAEALRLLKNNLKFTSLINQKYSKAFKAPESIGSSLRLRVPFNPRTRTGATANPQDFVEQYRTLDINTQKGSDVRFSSLEKALDIKEFSDRCLRNEMTNLAADIEATNMAALINKCSSVVTAASLTHTQAREAKARLAVNLAPIDNRLALFINPVDEVKILTGVETFFNAGKAIDEQYMNSSMGKALGFTWYESNLIPDLVTGSNLVRTVAVDANVAEGASTIDLKGLTASSTVLAGEVFTITSCLDVNYQTKTNGKSDKQFVVLEDATADASGDVTVSVYPIYAGGGTLNGASTDTLKNISALPVADDVVVFIGAANSTYSQSFAFHPDFATVGFVDPEVPADNNKGGKYTQDGIGMRYVEWFDGTNDVYLHRFDTYFGSTPMWEQWGVRIIEI